MWGQEAPTLLFPQILEVSLSSIIYFQSVFELILWSLNGWLCLNLQIISSLYSPGYEAGQGVIELSHSAFNKIREEPCKKNHHFINFYPPGKPIGCTYFERKHPNFWSYLEGLWGLRPLRWRDNHWAKKCAIGFESAFLKVHLSVNR